MKVVIIACMTCLFAVALTMGGPIRRQASQSEKTVPIRGNVTLLCPFVPDVTWQYVYWKKNDQTIYSLEVQSNTPTSSDTRYEGNKHATRLTIKDLKKTDSGMYHCKVVTTATIDFIEEGDQIQLSVTDEELGLSTTSPGVHFTTSPGVPFTTSTGVPFTTSTAIPPQPAEDKPIYLVSLILIPVFIIMCLVCMCWKRIKTLQARFVTAPRRLVSEKGEKILPPVGPVLIDDLYLASARKQPVAERMRKMLHSLVEAYKGKGAPPKDGEYSALLKKYVNSGNRCVPNGVLEDVEYFLDELDQFPVGRTRDVIEILLTMPENQEGGTSRTYSNKDIFGEYDQDDQAVKLEYTSRTQMLGGRMRSLLRESETRDAARNDISLIILNAHVKKTGSASFSHQTASTFNQSANETEQETSSLLQSDAKKLVEDNLIGFWLSKIIKLNATVQRSVSDGFDDLNGDVKSSSKESTTGRPCIHNDDAKTVNTINLNEITDRESEPFKSVWDLDKSLDHLPRVQPETEGTRSKLCPTDIHRTDDVDVDYKPEEKLSASQAFTSRPLGGAGLIDDHRGGFIGKRKQPVVKRMSKVLRSLLVLYAGEDAPRKGGKYAASSKKYVSSGQNGPEAEYALDSIPVGCIRDVCEILLTMPENQQEGTRLPSDIHGSDDVDVDDRPEESSNASQALTARTGETQLPLVAPVLIDDLCRASTSNRRRPVVKRMRHLLHTLVETSKGDGPHPKGGKYSASLKKYVSVSKEVLKDVEYFLDELDHIPVGRNILLTMPKNQEVDKSMHYSNNDIFLKNDNDDQVSAVKREHTSRTTILEDHMKSVLRRSETRDAARYNISLIMLEALVENPGSASVSQQAAPKYNQPAIEQETSFMSQRDEDLERDDDINLLEFWLSKVIKLDETVQRRVLERFDEFEQDIVSSSKPPKLCAPTSNNKLFAGARGQKDKN